MNDTSESAVLERLAERAGVLDNKTLTTVVRLLEDATRRTHGHVCDQQRHMRELEEETRQVHDAERSLTGRWENIWATVRIAFTLEGVRLLREIREDRRKTRNLVTILIHNLSAICQLDQRLERIEAAAGLSEHVPEQGRPS